MQQNENSLHSIKFIIGTTSGRKPPGKRINDTFFGREDIEVDSLTVANVPNTNNFTQDRANDDLVLGADSNFVDGDHVVVYYKYKNQ